MGRWWGAVGRRLRLSGDAYPLRIPMDLVSRLDRTEVRLRVSSTESPADTWTREHLIERIPGSGEGSS
ncbi:MAG TPA: hypothetical protein VJT49_07350 [Amycolatopsis sp.]|uniref:hypothetical protein n=1 Tax=Amycolatopsis sp. TaxID=37632 RepID=UPI002B46804F|nr:hypothetical protein [Amycolatopsis sp.]HKS44922.1 hypothetical protein [Amycolatopsis sp.]